MDWRERLSRDDGLRLGRAVPDHDLRLAEARVGVTLPDDLRSLYRSTDGVWDEPGQWYVIWPLADVVQRHGHGEFHGLLARAGLVAFGDDGTGNPFCVRHGDNVIYHWSAVDRAAIRVAADLAAFWDAWVADALPPH